jgi:hypothetical protein
VIHNFKVPQYLDKVLGHIVITADSTYDHVASLLLDAAFREKDTHGRDKVEATPIFEE